MWVAAACRSPCGPTSGAPGTADSTWCTTVRATRGSSRPPRAPRSRAGGAAGPRGERPGRRGPPGEGGATGAGRVLRGQPAAQHPEVQLPEVRHPGEQGGQIPAVGADRVRRPTPLQLEMGEEVLEVFSDG